MTVALRPAAEFSLDELAAVFTAAYQDYFVPFQIDAATLRFMVEAFDLDLDASRLALRDGEPVGLANLGLRRTEAWIGGIGVLPDARRRGLGELLMRELIEVARARGARRIALEVLEQNVPASRLYEKLGFGRTREVEVWSLSAAPAAGAADEVAVETAHDLIRALRERPEPWQRADETLAYYRTLDPPPQAVAVVGGAAIFRPTAAGVALLQLAGESPAARELLLAVRGRGDVSVLNLPVDDPAAEALRALGARVTARQAEMAL